MSKKLTWQTWRSFPMRSAERALQSLPRSSLARRGLSDRCLVYGLRWHQQIRTFADSHDPSPTVARTVAQASSKAIKERAQELDISNKSLYPRCASSSTTRSIKSLVAEVEHVPTGEPLKLVASDILEVSGRITSIRTSGSKLAFVDIVQDQLKLQVVLSLSMLQPSGITKDDFKQQCRLIRRGDFISIKGLPPYRASNGQVSIKAATLPLIESPCLNHFPLEQRGVISESSESHAHDRHVEMLTDPSVIETMKARATIVRTVRTFFESRSFIEVQTPVLSAAAGGAIARPFKTIATEFANRDLALRIAPELWLKRLIVGGMDRIFEIGPSFRNEGLDKTHNPEFTTCEFYAVRHDLPQLMQYTQDLLSQLAHAVDGLNYPCPPETHTLLKSIQSEEYKILDFIPALSAALEQPLPDLASPTAHHELLAIFRSKSLPLPLHPTRPILLDKLSSIYLEPQSLAVPTWIINMPECLSTLAKSFTQPSSSPSGHSQQVAARAELFIQGKELVNCYEEENSPFEQRRKFVEQQQYAREQPSSDGSEAHEMDPEVMPIDESYLRALEWGLPPTGGWGCGIDRLVMLLTGRERISDVLSFGNLRRVTRGVEKKNLVAS